VLFVCIVLAHARWRIVHMHITEPPSAQWTARQVVEASPWETIPRDLLRDRDAIDSTAFHNRVGTLGSEEVRIVPRLPWQKPSCERVIGSMRREALTMSSCCTSGICAASYDLTWPPITIGEPTGRWKEMRQSQERASHRHWVRSGSDRKSAVCIISTSA
jgi:hypothetical protein